MIRENIPYIQGFINPEYRKKISADIFKSYEDTPLLLVRDVRLLNINKFIIDVINTIPELKSKNIGVNMLLSKIYKLLIVPNDRINSKIKALNIDNDYSTIGVQVRMGGNLSDYKEKFTFMNETDLSELIPIIKKEIKALQTKNKEVIVYISSDSTYALNFIKRNLGDYKFCHLNNERGHSRIGNTTIIENSLTDLFMLAKSTVLIVTKGSSFGLMASYLRYPQRSIEYPYVNPYHRK